MFYSFAYKTATIHTATVDSGAEIVTTSRHWDTKNKAPKVFKSVRAAKKAISSAESSAQIDVRVWRDKINGNTYGATWLHLGGKDYVFRMTYGTPDHHRIQVTNFIRREIGLTDLKIHFHSADVLKRVAMDWERNYPELIHKA